MMFDKEELEKRKLRAEIDEIVQRKAFEKRRIESEEKKVFRIIPRGALKSLLISIPIVITILSGIVAIWIEVSGFLDRKEKEYAFTLNDNMIKLVKQLNCKNPDEREYAAILLSAYEKDAIPILLWNLERTDAPNATIKSLSLIKEKTKIETDKVLNPLLNSARVVFNRECHKPKMNIRPIRNYIMALGELGTEKKKSVIELLKNLKEQIDKKQPPFADGVKYGIRNEADNAINKLITNPGFRRKPHDT